MKPVLERKLFLQSGFFYGKECFMGTPKGDKFGNDVSQ